LVRERILGRARVPRAGERVLAIANLFFVLEYICESPSKSLFRRDAETNT